MADYNAEYIKKLLNEVNNRYVKLKNVLNDEKSYSYRCNKVITISGMEVRLAVDDFKVILAEVRKLK